MYFVNTLITLLSHISIKTIDWLIVHLCCCFQKYSLPFEIYITFLLLKPRIKVLFHFLGKILSPPSSLALSHKGLALQKPSLGMPVCMVDGRVGLHLLDAQLVRQGGHLLLSQGGLQVLRHRSDGVGKVGLHILVPEEEKATSTARVKSFLHVGQVGTLHLFSISWGRRESGRCVLISLT